MTPDVLLGAGVVLILAAFAALVVRVLWGREEP